MTTIETQNITSAGASLSSTLQSPRTVDRMLDSSDEHKIPLTNSWSFSNVGAVGNESAFTGAGARPLRVPHLFKASSNPPAETFSLLEKWDGMVIATDKDTFTARLFSSTELRPPVQAVFSKDEISEEEQVQVEEGATFIWTIGYRNVGSTRRRDSVLYFRRLPTWNESELNQSAQRGRLMGEAIGW